MKPSVAIVTPLYRRQLSREEEISLRQLREHLGHYDRFIIAPEGLPLEGFDDFRIVRFHPRFFRGIPGYNQLMLTRRFYEKFRAYEFMLIYQADALVFSDALPQWCSTGWDYLGAPIFLGKTRVEENLLCLNGGLSLRRIPAFLSVLHARLPRQIAAICRGTPFMERNAPTRALKRVLVTLHQLGLVNVIPWLVHRNTCHEDVVWSRYAPLFDPRFRVAPSDVARKFSMEEEPSLEYEKNSRELPFACHAWTRWEPDFWRQFLPPDESDRPMARHR